MAGALALAGCGSSGSGSSTTSSSSAATSSSAAASAESSASSAESSAGSAASSGSATAASGSGSASGPSQADIDAAKATLISTGKITTCTHLPYAPFQSNDDSGKTVGFDVDMIDLVAKVLGVEQTVVDTPFEGIQSGQDLSTGKCDIAAAGMTILPERVKVILFSEPYFDATQAMLIRSGDSYTSLADLKGKKVGAQASTTGLKYANKNQAANGYEVVEFQDLASQQQALVTNQIDAAINDYPVWSAFIKEQPGKTKIAATFNTGEQYGMGMKLGNEALKKVVDAVFAQAKSDGTYDKIYEQWIGEVPAG